MLTIYARLLTSRNRLPTDREWAVAQDRSTTGCPDEEFMRLALEQQGLPLKRGSSSLERCSDGKGNCKRA